MSIKIYEYKNCSSCQNAIKYLNANLISYEKVAIVDHPPTLNELNAMLKHLKSMNLDFKKLFNTSGVQYRELQIADQIKAGMTEQQALQLLSKNGKLIKRPFLLKDNQTGLLGFKKDQWDSFFK